MSTASKDRACDGKDRACHGHWPGRKSILVRIGTNNEDREGYTEEITESTEEDESSESWPCRSFCQGCYP